VTSPYQFAHDAYAGALQSAYSYLGDGEESGSERGAWPVGSSCCAAKASWFFATMRDSSGEIQLFVLDGVAENFEEFAKLHLGDWVGASGEVVRTKRGELSVKVATWERTRGSPAQLWRQVGGHRGL